MSRKSKSDLPRGTIKCPNTECVYNQFGECDDIRINRGNSDSKCHKDSIVKILGYIGDQK